MEHLPRALSFDDILLVPRKSAILPADADLTTSLTQGIELNIPIVSSAMDTVTETGLAIALAREGGLGVIHRNMPVSDQAEMVERVKRSENMIIADPFTVTPETSVEALQLVMAEKGVNGFPVITAEGVLVGMVTTRDIWLIENRTATVANVMTPRENVITAPVETTLMDARRMLYRHRIEKLPLVDSHGKLAGLITSQDIEKRAHYTNASKDLNGHLRVGAAIGVGEDCFERAAAVIAAGADAVFIDASTGHTVRAMKVIERLRSKFRTPVVAGNVVTGEGAADLCAAGASAVKVGVGPGSICTTRVISGVGAPQFTAIQEVAGVCRKRGIPVIADGGIRYSGDIVKALAAGADVVMLGSLLAGCEESPGTMIHFQGRAWKEYRGMGSLKAMRRGSGDRYGQNASGKLVAEGVEARINYRGSVADTIFQLTGGLRSGMGYVGASNLNDLREKARFVRVTTNGLKESHPHDVTITEEPVNYRASF